MKCIGRHEDNITAVSLWKCKCKGNLSALTSTKAHIQFSKNYKEHSSIPSTSF